MHTACCNCAWDLRHPDTVYDLKRGSLKEAVTRYFPELHKIKAKNLEYLARCAHCFLKGLCEQCPAKSWAEHGTLDTPVDYYCEIAHTDSDARLAEGESIELRSSLPVHFTKATVRWIKKDADNFYKMGLFFVE